MPSSERLRVLQVTDLYLPSMNGISYHIAELMQGLPRLGVDTALLAPAVPPWSTTSSPD